MTIHTDVESYLASHQEALKSLIRDLCAIPAPSHHEELRAEFCLEWFHNNGCPEAFLDEALNVIAPYRVAEEGPVALLCAHTDTVFPDIVCSPASLGSAAADATPFSQYQD